jgi:alkaline phosphatase
MGSEINRRQFIASSAAAAVGASLLGPSGSAMARAPKAQARPNAKAKNLIFMVADGLSFGSLTLGDLVSRRTRGRGLRWLEWIASGAARRALIATDAADRLITDSAASASAWSIGERVNNDVLSITPDGRRPTPLFIRLKQAGMTTGVVTNTAVVDASPAAMLVNSPSRSDLAGIAGMYFERDVDLVVGGGRQYFTKELIVRYPQVRMAASLGELQAGAEEPERVFALLSEGDLPAAIDRRGAEPAFVDLVRASLAHVQNAPNGFALFLESEDTDNTAHDNDGAGLAHAVMAFDDGVAAALDFCRGRDDTLLIVTTDHANANPGFARYGNTEGQQFERLCAAKESFRSIFRRLRAMSGPKGGAALAALLRDGQGVELDERDIDILDRWLMKEQVEPLDLRNKIYSPMGSVVGNHLGVAFNSHTHTADHVEATAMGPGAELLPPLGHLVDIHTTIVGALGVG